MLSSGFRILCTVFTLCAGSSSKSVVFPTHSPTNADVTSDVNISSLLSVNPLNEMEQKSENKYHFVWFKTEADFTRLKSILWPELDLYIQSILSNSKASSRAHRSGGIFLYERQAHILLAITIRLLQWQDSEKRLMVCETGFGAGHSAILWLTAGTGVVLDNTTMEVVSFDSFDRVYQEQAIIWIEEHLIDTPIDSVRGNMMELTSIKGNSCDTVPQFFMVNKKVKGLCDIIHGSSLCPSDNIDLVVFGATCGTVLTTTSMDSLHSAVYFGGKSTERTSSPLLFSPSDDGQWQWLLRNGCIADVNCYDEASFILEHDFVFDKKGTVHSAKFCIGLVTSGCQSIPMERAFENVDQDRWIIGYGRMIRKDAKARKTCINSVKYKTRSSLLNSVSKRYIDSLIPPSKYII